MSRLQLRHSMMGLFVFTGIFHLVIAAIGSDRSIAGPLALFGLVYLGLSYYIRKDVSGGGAKPVAIATGATALAFCIGLYHMLANGGPLAVWAMLAIDIAIVAAGAAWLSGAKKKA